MREIETPDSRLLHDSYEIEKHFYEHFKNILETPDPFCKESFCKFINPVKDKFGKIKDSDKESFNKEISAQEICLTT